MKISLGVIAKDELPQIKRIIKDYDKYFDELYFLIDDDETLSQLEPLKTDKLKFSKYIKSQEEIDSGHIYFDRKRNTLTDLLSGEYYVRIDTDDKIINPENIRPLCEKAKSQGINIVYCFYEYSKDEYGNVHAAHYRETIIRVTDDLKWNKHIHENIIPSETSAHRFVMDDTVVIEHMIDYDHVVSSEKRNFEYLIEEYNKDKEDTDPRTLAYLGRMLFGRGDLDKSQFFLEQHIAKSGWDEDRYMSWCLLSEIMSKKGQFKDAIGCCFEAIAERQDYPDAYFKLQSIYIDQEKWAEALHWGKIGFQIPIPKTFMLLDPSSYGWRPMLAQAYAHLQLGQVEEAYTVFQEVKKRVPTLDSIVKNEHIFLDAVERKEYTDHFVWLYNYLKAKDPNKLESFFNAVPSNLDDHEGLMNLKHSTLPPKKWNNKSIVFFCGITPAEWADPSVLKGIGGSEEAVIYLSRAFAKMGHEVTVYCKCGRLEGKYNGVTYLNSYKFNPRDTFNVIFSWRSNIFGLSEVKANKRFIWLHDLPQNSQFTKGSYPFDKVIVLSEYHKSLLPDHIPEEKVFVSTNGINLPDFDNLDNIQQQPNRLIYASSYDRGLEVLLDGWADIKKAVPEAELHIFYGWNTYKELMSTVSSSRNETFVSRMEKLMSQDGVYEHGRVGHKELLKEYARSRVFAYPCTFPGEINCIALTKAIATKCIPVTNDFAVMPERNPYGVSTNEEFISRVIDELKNPSKVKVDSDEYKKDNSWFSVAKQWKNHLIGGINVVGAMQSSR